MFGSLSRSIAYAGVLLACLVSAASATTPPPYLPSVRIGVAPLIDPSAANTLYGSATTSTDGLMGITGHATPVAPEIVELARALKDDPDLIYQYVRNNIETEWMYGLAKGPLGATIDKSGTPFDQAALLVALLQQAGTQSQTSISASFQSGTVSLTAQQFGQATGLIHGLNATAQTFAVDAKAACQFLASGGIPALVEGTTNCASLTGDLPTTGMPVVMAHIWVVATIPGSAASGCTSNVCVFDPAMKMHIFKTGFAQAAIAMTSGDPLMDAETAMGGGTTTSGLPYVNTLNKTQLETRLSGYATAYLNYLKNPANLVPGTQIQVSGAQIEDAVGGMVLAPVNTPVRQAALPYPDTLLHSWTAIPDQYRTTLEVKADEVMVPFVNPPLPPQPATDYPLFDKKFFSDEIYGRRLTVATNFNSAEMTLQKYYDYIVTLRLDDQALVTTDIGAVAAVAPDAHSPATFQIQVDHPYAATTSEDTVAQSYMDAKDERALHDAGNNPGTDHSIYKNAMLATPLSIVAAWGATGPAMLAKWADERDHDTELPPPLVNYGGCETCYPTTINLTGDFTREKVQASFLAQNARAIKLHAALASSREQIHHIVGLVYADDYMDDNGFQAPPDAGKDFKVADTYTRIDVDTGISLTSETSDAVGRRAALQAIASTSAAIEGSIMAQMEDVPDTASTATRFEWGNTPTCANHDATDPNGCEDPASVSAPIPRNFFQFQPSTTIPSNWALWENHDAAHLPASNTNDGYGNPQLWAGDFLDVLTNDIAAYQSHGFQVTASQESFLGPGQRGGYMKSLEIYTGGMGPPQVPTYTSVWTKQRGGALVATRYDGNGDPVEIAHVVVGMVVDSSNNTIIPVKGGGGGAQPATGATYDPADAGDVLKSKFVDKSNALGVNLANGSLAVDSPVSLKAGSGDFPYSLSVGASWHPGAGSPVPQPNWSGQVGWVPSWNSALSLSGSGMEALGTSDIRGAAGAIAAFMAEQDIYKSAPSAGRDVAAVLTQSWWMHQLTANVATVSLGGGSRQFVRLADNSWIASGPGYATMIQNGTRSPTNYICPIVLHPQDPQYAQSRGWDESAMSFDVVNQHGDVQHFGYYEYKYDTDSGVFCARQLGFRLDNWSFPQGPIVSLTYGADSGAWNLERVTNNMGQQINLDYAAGGYFSGADDNHGRAIGYTSAGATDTLGHFTGFGFLTPQPTTATHRPVPFALLSTITTPEAPTVPHTQYGYDSLGRINQVWDAEALQKFDRAPYQFFLADGTRGARQDPLGGLYSVVYDTYGHPSRTIDENGHETDALFDSRSRPYTYTFPEGDCEAFTYDGQNNTTSYYRIDKTGACNLTAAGSHRILTQATWDQTWNKPLTIKTPLGNTTTFSYYAVGTAGAGEIYQATRPAVYFDATHTVSPLYTFTYDAMGKMVTSTVPFSLTHNIISKNTYASTTEYLTSTILDYGGLNITTSFGYDAYGNVTSTTDPRANAGTGGGVTEDFYDSERRKTESHHHDGNIGATLNQASRTTYDAIGRDMKDESGLTFSGASTILTWQTDKTTTYTPTSKIASGTDADGSVTLTAYDGVDRTDTTTDPVGRKTHFDYDLAGNTLHEYRAWQASSPLRQVYAAYSYGVDNEKLNVSDANGNLTAFGYDGFNRLLTTTYPDSTVAHPDIDALAYDKDSNITTRTTRAGQAITYTFDKLDRMIEKDVPAVSGVNPPVATKWTYYLNAAVNDLADYLNGSTTKNNDLTYGYDTAARMTSVSTGIPGVSGSLVLGYVLDLNGNRTQLTWPDGYFVTYAYDSLDRMTTVKESGTSTLATYNYNSLSRRTSIAYPNASMAYTYSPAGDLLTLNHAIAGTGTVPAYTLGFTPAHQLSSEVSSQASYTYQPTTVATDSYGTPNSLNQYKTINSAPANGRDCQGNAQQYSYDCNGNLTGDGTWSYAYDPENHLITANKISDGTVSATYAYDPLGRRTHKSGAGVTETYFVDDGTDEIAEYNASGTPVTRYVPGPAINEPVVSVTVSSGAHRYFQTDHHGSVIAIVSQGGNELEGPYTYDAYGNGAPTAGVAYKYVGMRLDPETGLYYDRERYYWSGGGRFLQTDPVGYSADLNLYTYSGNDPLGEIDPSGRRPVDVYVWRGDFSKGWAGHIMVTEHGSHKVILSQWPHKPGAETSGHGPNITFTYGQTFQGELWHHPDQIFVVNVPDDNGFDQSAATQRNRSYWDWDPNGETETNCVFAAEKALKSGGVNIDDSDWFPRGLGDQLESNPASKISQPEQAETPKDSSQKKSTSPKSHKWSMEGDWISGNACTGRLDCGK